MAKSIPKVRCQKRKWREDTSTRIHTHRAEQCEGKEEDHNYGTLRDGRICRMLVSCSAEGGSSEILID